MDAFRMMKGARTVVEVCASVRPGESVVVVTDSASLEVADAIAAAASAIPDVDVVVTVMPPRDVDGAEPPRAVVEAMKTADVLILPVSYSISHSEGLRSALRAGARAVSLAAVTPDQLVRGGIEADFPKLRPMCNEVARRLGEANQAILRTPGGTDVRLDLTGQPGNAHGCIVDQPGRFTACPNIEANISPVEGVGEGVIVFDGSIPNLRLGVVDEPVVVEVEAGSIRDIRGGRHARILRSIWERQDDPSVYNIAQLAVGLNPKCTAFTGVFLNDHGAYGTVHIGIGTSASLGGSLQAPLHFDGMMYAPTLELDGEAVVRDGAVLVGDAQALVG
jgi:leucyl aminopeptidase (aminopeptidase T)